MIYVHAIAYSAKAVAAIRPVLRLFYDADLQAACRSVGAAHAGEGRLGLGPGFPLVFRW